MIAKSDFFRWLDAHLPVSLIPGDTVLQWNAPGEATKVVLSLKLSLQELATSEPPALVVAVIPRPKVGERFITNDPAHIREIERAESETAKMYLEWRSAQHVPVIKKAKPMTA